VYGRQAWGPASFTTMTPAGTSPAGDGLGADVGLAVVAHRACDQSSGLCGTVPFTKNSVVENGESEVG